MLHTAATDHDGDGTTLVSHEILSECGCNCCVLSFDQSWPELFYPSGGLYMVESILADAKWRPSQNSVLEPKHAPSTLVLYLQ